MHLVRIAAFQYIEKDSNEIIGVTYPAFEDSLPLDFLLLHRVCIDRAVLSDFRQDHRHKIFIDFASILREYAV